MPKVPRCQEIQAPKNAAIVKNAKISEIACFLETLQKMVFFVKVDGLSAKCLSFIQKL